MKCELCGADDPRQDDDEALKDRARQHEREVDRYWKKEAELAARDGNAQKAYERTRHDYSFNEPFLEPLRRAIRDRKRNA